MRIAPGYMLRNIADSWVAIPVGNTSGDRGMISLSGSSAMLWGLLESGADRDRLVGAILETYSVDKATAEKDVDVFLAELEEEGLLIKD